MPQLRSETKKKLEAKFLMVSDSEHYHSYYYHYHWHAKSYGKPYTVLISQMKGCPFTYGDIDLIFNSEPWSSH